MWESQGYIDNDNNDNNNDNLQLNIFIYFYISPLYLNNITWLVNKIGLGLKAGRVNFIFIAFCFELEPGSLLWLH